MGRTHPYGRDGSEAPAEAQDTRLSARHIFQAPAPHIPSKWE